ncbi:MAG TPA: hypothetical protein VN577_11420 [Terriglobales bacterium]|nr:hypothetical protein [Terriglobales bacterium]
MRSNLVFRATDKVSNRFVLCLMVSRSARTMTRRSVQMHDAINDAFTAIGKHVGNCCISGDLTEANASPITREESSVRAEALPADNDDPAAHVVNEIVQA